VITKNMLLPSRKPVENQKKTWRHSLVDVWWGGVGVGGGGSRVQLERKKQ
jgi:hypothetical protein